MLLGKLYGGVAGVDEAAGLVVERLEGGSACSRRVNCVLVRLMPSLRWMYRPDAKNHALFFLIGPLKAKSGCRESDTALMPPGVLFAFQLRGEANSAAAP